MPAVKITSLRNPQIKNLIDLRERKTRDQTGLTIVEGWREFAAAQSAGVSIKEVFVCREHIKEDKHNDLLKKFSKDMLFETSTEVFSKICFGEREEGIVAVCQPRPRDLKSLVLKDKPLVVIVEHVEKPGNLGAIIRTADAASVDALIVCDPKTDIYNPNVLRASIGTIFAVPVVSSRNEEVQPFLKNRGIKVCATFPEAKTIYTKVNMNIPLAIVLGSEEKGLSPFWHRTADTQVKIPMRGQADSLNVSTTAAIMMFEALRQREGH